MCEHGDTVPMPINGRVRDIDRCIAHLVAGLNAANIPTVACCCGHGHRPGLISLQDGRELAILDSFETYSKLTKEYPDIHGEKL